MAIYVAMEPPAEAQKRGKDVLFVRDGFHFFAFLVPVFWLLWHRLWIEAVLALAVTLALSALGEVAGFGWASPLLTFIVSIYFGLEAANLRVAALRRRGWREWGVVEADDLAGAEARQAVDDEARPQPVAPRPVQAVPVVLAANSGPALGLFDYPGRS